MKETSSAGALRHSVWNVLKSEPRQTTQQLCEKLGCEYHSVRAALDRMFKYGLVARSKIRIPCNNFAGYIQTFVYEAVGHEYVWDPKAHREIQRQQKPKPAPKPKRPVGRPRKAKAKAEADLVVVSPSAKPSNDAGLENMMKAFDTVAHTETRFRLLCGQQPVIRLLMMRDVLNKIFQL